MTALAKDRNTKCRHLDYVLSVEVEAGEILYGGALVTRDTDGYAMPAQDTANHEVCGVSKRKYDNSAGADGAIRAEVDQGIFAYATTGANALTKADEGGLAYVLDDQTIVRAAGTTNSVIAGKIVEWVSASEIWIDTRIKTA
jgi:hypothetical protein